MKRLLLVVAVIAAASLIATMRDVRHASACSGPPGWEAMAAMPVVLEGHVTGVERLADPDINREAHRYTLSVSTGHRGASAGDQFVFVDERYKPGIPSPCAQLQPDLVNKWIVAAFQNSDGAYRTGARVAPFIGDELAGPDYLLAVRAAEIATGSNPAGPKLTPLDATITCGQNAVMVGRQFEPRATYTLTHLGGFTENTAVRITADDGGHFKAPLKGYYGACPDREIAVYIWALAGTVDEFSCCDVPVALARLQVKPAAVAPGPPDTGNTVDGDECLYSGDRARLSRSAVILEAEVTGGSTPPQQPTVMLFPQLRPVIVFHGKLRNEPFVTAVRVEPRGTCDVDLLRRGTWVVLGLERSSTEPGWSWETSTAVVLFAGTELAGPEYDDAIAEVRAALPGGPGLGSGTVLSTSPATLPWGDVVLVVLLVMAFAGGTGAIVRSSRRR